MSYSKAMKWNKRHPKGTRQTCIMHTNSGFTPAIAWLEHKWWPYLEKCQTQGIEPMECETYYKSQLR
jgi:hypothetical protein